MFELGRDDPELVLLEVVPMYAEYWDRSGVEAVKFSLALAKSLVSGKPPVGDSGVHSKVRFSEQRDPTAPTDRPYPAPAGAPRPVRYAAWRAAQRCSWSSPPTCSPLTNTCGTVSRPLSAPTTIVRCACGSGTST
jgi:hypothetical protein